MSRSTRRGGSGRLGIGIAIATLGALVFAACGDDSSSSTTTAASDTTASAATTSAASGATTTAASGEPITIGVFQPLAAAIGGFGQPAVDGAQLAVSEINAAGGINGRPLSLTIQDDGCSSTDGANAVQKLLSENPKPVALIGGLCSDPTLAALPIVERNGVPLLVDLASNPSISDQSGVGGNEWVFRWAPNDTVTAKSSVQFLSGLGTIKKIAIIASDDSFGKGGQTALTDAAKAAGIEVVSSDAVNLASADFAPIIARIKTAKPDAVALWMNAGPTVSSFYEQYGGAGLQNIPLVGQLDLNQDAIKTYSLSGYNSAGYNNAVDTPQNTAYLAAWKAAGKADGDAYVGWDGYQSVYILAAALKSAASIDPAAIKDALKALEFSPTILGGTIKFDDHNQAHDKVVIQQFTGTTTVKVFLLDQPA